jgi:hypothetical protein
MCPVEEAAAVNVDLVDEFGTWIVDKGQESPEEGRWIRYILEPLNAEDVQERLASSIYGL